MTTAGTHHARMLAAAVPLLSGLGLDVRWQAPTSLDGDLTWSDALHKAIEGELRWQPRFADAWRRYSQRHAAMVDGSFDFVTVHDPQLLMLRAQTPRSSEHARWLWHCHFDLRDCDESVAELMTNELADFDLVAIEHPTFAGSIGMPAQIVIPPVIDPLSGRNSQLPPRVIDSVLRRFELKPESPLIVEVSPFDGWDDPQWAIYEYQAASKVLQNLQLVLVATSTSTDEPFSQLNGARHNGNIRFLTSREAGDLEINALQGAAVLAMQNAVRKGFSTSLLEASWKGRPVLASEGGAMSHQVLHGTTGFVFATFDEAAERIVQLVNDRNLSDALGFNGHRMVRDDHLVVSWVESYLRLLASAQPTVA
jgi:trehalose synthase